MRLAFLLFFVLPFGYFFNFCSQPSNPKAVRPETSPVDTSTVAIIVFNQNYDWPFKHTYTPTTLSENEIQQLDSLFRQCIFIYNSNLASDRKRSYSIDFLKYKYKRQYIAVINDKGEKEVWINCFCNAQEKHWKTKIILVEDGGNCYFNLKINLTTKDCFEVSVNGYS